VHVFNPPRTSFRLIHFAICIFHFAICNSPAEAADLPTSGTPVESLKAFDEAVLSFMREISASSGTLAVAHGGRLVLERGYGWSDAAHQTPTAPDTIMRIASVTKPMTCAAVKRLIASGKLTLDTPAFPLLNLQQPPGSTPDPRLQQITVGQLLEHKGGWDIAALGYDPIFADMRVMLGLRSSRSPTPTDVIRYMMTQPLSFDPGSRSAYSNLGYSILGRVIEKTTGTSYGQHMQQTLWQPLGMSSTALAHAQPKDRPPREVHYDPAGETLPMERFDSVGGVTSTAGDLCRFLGAYWISGDPRPSPAATGYSYTFFGSLPECTAMVRQLPDGTNIAALLNHRRPSFKDDNTKLRQRLDAAAASIAAWPR
jgi:N-acyl-D-amino-acid deacylase